MFLILPVVCVHCRCFFVFCSLCNDSWHPGSQCMDPQMRLQVLRERMEYTLHEPFVTTVLARGVSESALRSRHVLRHAAIPALTLSTLILGSLLSGAAVLETLFARPGLGRIAVSAVADRDIPVVLGTVVFAALVFVIVNTLVDLVYPLFDPRLREARR